MGSLCKYVNCVHVHICMQGVHVCWHVGACVSLILCDHSSNTSQETIHAGCGVRVSSGSTSLLTAMGESGSEKH